MNEKQFAALLNYFDKRIELQWNRDNVSSKYFYVNCTKYKGEALIAAGFHPEIDDTE